MAFRRGQARHLPAVGVEVEAAVGVPILEPQTLRRAQAFLPVGCKLFQKRLVAAVQALVPEFFFGIDAVDHREGRAAGGVQAGFIGVAVCWLRRGGRCQGEEGASYEKGGGFGHDGFLRERGRHWDSPRAFLYST